ncbi:MAG: hypothetical protein CUN52_02260 [Phototrophicales bacterium]|nr:MAG: hypothetical protein CUN52_02260 [Phototrophicales bacterium]
MIPIQSLLKYTMGRARGIASLLFLLCIWVFVTSYQTSNAQSLTGRIDNNTPFVEVPIAVFDDNSRLTISLVATSGNLDPLLYLVDANGNIIAENDDVADGDINAYIEFIRPPFGKYTVIATRFGVDKGDTSGEFSLSISQQVATVAEAQADLVLNDVTLANAGYPQLPPQALAEWTILVYSGGDSNLEASVMNDLDEFERAGGSTEKVRIIALLDRHPDYSTANGDIQTAQLFEIGADVSQDYGVVFPATLDSTPLADLGVVDSGDYHTLAQFLHWGMNTYPAKRYAVVLAGHGAAWQGVVADESTGNSITLAGLHNALDAVMSANHITQFDLLVNDACSMSNLEYLTTIAPFFAYTFASPEIIVDPGLDMTTLTTLLNENPDALQVLGEQLVDVYIGRDTRDRRGIDNEYLGLAFTDLSRFAKLSDSLTAFADIINTNPIEYSNIIGQARANTYTYSAFLDQNDLIDAGDLMQQLIAYSSDMGLISLARDVLSALDDVRLYAQAAPRVQGRISFYSIYFPAKSKNFDRDYPIITPLGAWGQMLRNYYNAITPRLWQADDSLQAYHPPIAPKVRVTRVYPSVSSIVFPPTISVEIVGRRIASGAFTIDRIGDDGVIYRLAENRILTEVVTDTTVNFVNSWKSGVDQSYFNWLPMTLPMVTDGMTSEFEFLTRTGDNASLNGRYREQGNDRWNDVTVIFNLDGSVRDVITQTASGALAAVKIPIGAEFQSYRYVVKSGGNLISEPNVLYTWGENRISWRPQAAPSGTYNLGFLVSAFGGASGFDSAQVIVNNEQFPPDLAGYADINLGVNFQRPAGWSAIADLGGWLTASSPSGDATLNVYYFRAPDDIFGVLQTAQRRFEFELIGAAQAYRWQGELGLRFSHIYRTSDGIVWNGEALVFHRLTAQGERGMMFSLDTRQGARANRDALFRAMANSIQFFDAQSLKLDDAADWRYEFINRIIPYPIIKTWQDTTRFSDGIWRVYRPVNDASRLTIATIAQLDYPDRQTAMDAVLAQFAEGGTFTQRVYNGEHHEWLTASFEVIRGGQPMVGRVYITELNNRLYAFRFETPKGISAVTIFRDFFEPMVDGFAPPSDIKFSTGTRTAFVKSAIITANDSCRDVLWNTICSGGGLPVQMLVVDDTGEITLQTNDATYPTQDVLAFRVGVDDQGNIDPFSVALVNIQANIPDSNTAENIKLIVFGGATVVNKGILPPNTIDRLVMMNPLDIRVNIRNLPSTNVSLIIESLIPTQQVIAVARTEDNQWVRVILPNNPYQTGWIRSDLLQVVDENLRVDMLKVGNPSLPHYSAMQSIDILFDEALDPTVSLNGVLIQTTPSRRPVYLEINGALFEIAGGSMFFWRGDVAGLESVSASEQADAFGDVASRRRPSSWSSEVLSGSVRIQIANADVQATITSVAGTQVQFDENQNDVTLSVADRSGGSLNSVLSSSLGVVQVGGNLTAEEIRRLQAVQGNVNALDLTATQDLPFFFGTQSGVFYFNQASFSDANVLDYLFSQSPNTSP